MNSEKEILKKRFLDGETTLDDEWRLRTLLDSAEDDGERALRMIVGTPSAGGPYGAEDFEAWIAEDCSAEYDAIVAGRRRQTMTRVAAWIAVAVIVGVVFLGTVMQWDSRPKGNGNGQLHTELSANNSVNGKKAESSFGASESNFCSSESSFGTSAENVIAQAAAKPAAVRNSKKEARGTRSTVKETMDAEKDAAMIDRVRHVEQMLNEIGDSVYLAHVEEMIESNDDLQRLAEYITRNDAGRYRYATLYEDEMLEEQDEEYSEQREF